MIDNFDTGISSFWTNFNFLENTKRITGTAWKTFASDTSVKFQNKAVPEMYENNEKGFKDVFEASVKEAIKTEILEK